MKKTSNTTTRLKKRGISLALAVLMLCSTIGSAGMTAFANPADGIATVTGSAVNVRASAGTNNERVAVVYRGERYTVMGSAKDSSGVTWYEIEYRPGERGYVTSQFVKYSEDAVTPALPNAPSTGTVTVTGSTVNIRSGAGTTYSKIGKANAGDTFTLIGKSTSSNGRVWFKVDIGNGVTGYITSQYAKSTGNGVGTTSTSQILITTTAPVVTTTGNDKFQIVTVTRGSTAGTQAPTTTASTTTKPATTIMLPQPTTTAAPSTTSTATTGTTTAGQGEKPSINIVSITRPTTTVTTTTTTTKPSSPSVTTNGALLPSGSNKASHFKGMSTKKFIDSIALLAVHEMEQNDILASVTIAQAILESASGSSKVAQNKNNLFGVMTGPSTYKSYSSVQESFRSHSKVLKQSYYNNSSRKVIGNRDYKSVIRSLVGVYATDPNYGVKLTSIIQEYNLTKYDKMTTADFGYKSGSSNQAAPNTTRPTSGPVASTGTVTVTCDTLRVRDGAGTNNSKIGTVHRGETYAYSETKTVDGTVWYCIQTDGTTGWISGDYVD